MASCTKQSRPPTSKTRVFCSRDARDTIEQNRSSKQVIGTDPNMSICVSVLDLSQCKMAFVRSTAGLDASQAASMDPQTPGCFHHSVPTAHSCSGWPLAFLVRTTPFGEYFSLHIYISRLPHLILLSALFFQLLASLIAFSRRRSFATFSPALPGCTSRLPGLEFQTTPKPLTKPHQTT